MTITTTLPLETEQRLRAHAEATGKNTNTLVVEAIEARISLSQPSLRNILEPVYSDFHRSGMTWVELDKLLQEARDETRSVRASEPGPSA